MKDINDDMFQRYQGLMLVHASTTFSVANNNSSNDFR